ncbi:hypothetical protein [Streptomyces salyersiae]|uniref:Uncharacterized protein n=1 Tax=Streptomyces salyersiae TaxID=3075530 RepID=A0ABU2RVE7_9ACTN|nr:hypothetical protein [Streptomyces sp. DSM 41770]MDT0432811.1 hypothetical protein [Streptomyces sp. DSM 41770]
MSVRSAWLLPGGTEPGQTREDTRLSPVGTMTPTGPMTTRPGVIPGGQPFAASAAGAMSLQIGPGRAVAQGTTAQGAYPVALDAPASVSFDDGDALSDRIDTVVVRVLDGLYDISGSTLATVEIVKGEPSATPAPATLDPACTPLWDVTVHAGTSAGVGGIDWGSALTDRRRYTVAVGGIVPRGALGDAGAYDGQYADIGGTLYRWSAAEDAWQQYPPPALRPQVTRQVAAPPYTPTQTYVDFTAAAWPRITFTVPPSGAVWVTVGGSVSNRATDASTAWLTWRATGGLVEPHSVTNGLSAQASRVIASRRVYRSGLTPGASVTLIPGWNVSSVGQDTLIANGELTVEPVQ